MTGEAKPNRDPQSPADPSPVASARLLASTIRGDENAVRELTKLFYNELRTLAARCLAKERRDHTLHPTALVNEAYLRLVGGKPIPIRSKAHFKALAALTMRRVLIDYARTKPKAKRVTLFSVAVPDQALDAIEVTDLIEELRSVDERQARVVELRVFGALTSDEIATVLGVTSRTVRTYWREAMAWLLSKLRKHEG